MSHNPSLQESSRGRAFIISIVGGLTLLTLAVTVFAVASQARSVSSQAEQSVRIIEDLRVVSIARAELSIASRVASLSPDQTEVLATTLGNAETALDAVEENFDEQTSIAVLETFAEYRTAATHQSELILAGDVDRQSAIDAEIATGEAFNNLSNVLRDEQVAALEGLRSDNDLMNLISTIATFIVAFVVPSAALYIFEALRRAPRRARRLEQEYEEAAATSLAMAAAVSKEAVKLRTAIDGMPPSNYQDLLRRSVLRLEHVSALNGSGRSLTNEDVNLVELARSVITSTGQHVAVHAAGAENAAVLGDREQISLVLTELLHNAINHGSVPVALEIAADGPTVVITVSDQGPGLPDVVEDAIIHDNHYAARGNLLSGAYGFGLLAAREATESLGGRLRYERRDNRTLLIVELPKGEFRRATKPTEVSVPAALQGSVA